MLTGTILAKNALQCGDIGICLMQFSLCNFYWLKMLISSQFYIYKIKSSNWVYIACIPTVHFTHVMGTVFQWPVLELRRQEVSWSGWPLIHCSAYFLVCHSMHYLIKWANTFDLRKSVYLQVKCKIFLCRIQLISEGKLSQLIMVIQQYYSVLHSHIKSILLLKETSFYFSPWECMWFVLDHSWLFVSLGKFFLSVALRGKKGFNQMI